MIRFGHIETMMLRVSLPHTKQCLVSANKEKCGGKPDMFNFRMEPKSYKLCEILLGSFTMNYLKYMTRYFNNICYLLLCFSYLEAPSHLSIFRMESLFFAMPVGYCFILVQTLIFFKEMSFTKLTIAVEFLSRV